MNPRHILLFRSFIQSWFKRYGREALPWRQNYDPYYILVSEIMLQQTQVERVIPKFIQFTTSFPNLETLANASTADVLKHWQGLGYNRRALNLHKTAKTLIDTHQHTLPNTEEELLQLPGIGPYTARAICTFAYNQPKVVIETNIRTIFIYHFFPEQSAIPDSALIPFIEATLNHENPRTWYSALMDYGTFLKSVLPNPNRKSKHFTKQSKFEGSNRQLRGSIIRQLTLKEQLSSEELLATIPEKDLFDQTTIQVAIEKLISEGFIHQTNSLLMLRK